MNKKQLFVSIPLAFLGLSSLMILFFLLRAHALSTELFSSFEKPAQFMPTRVYSNVTPVFIGAARSILENRLKSLSYLVQKSPKELYFTLHDTNYPDSLVTQTFLAKNPKNKVIRLLFEDVAHPDRLSGIQIGSEPSTELFLEPELLATLSKSGATRMEIREVLKLTEIPSPIWKAIIAVEDQHFLEHKGIDPRGIARAIFINLKTFSLAQGGSTLTQQLVKNLTARRTKNIFRKISEVFLTLWIEARFEKEQILERYLNEVYLGQIGNLEVHGVAEGAKYFFGKRIDELNLAETAMMAGLIRGPGFYNPYKHKDRAIARMKLVLQKMSETSQISAEEAKSAETMPIRLAPPIREAMKAPYFVDFVKSELERQLKLKVDSQDVLEASLRVYTTLDVEQNQLAQNAVSDGIEKLTKQFKLPKNLRLEGALASVDQTTGEIKAIIGGRNYDQSNFNRLLNMKRQAGSTFKPFVYLAAIEKGKDEKGIAYGAAYPVYDSPLQVTYDSNQPEWKPKNYEPEYRGLLTLREALAHSVNTAAARIGLDVGFTKIIETAHALGIESDLKPVPSLVLGTAEVSPIELLRAYSTLANRGTFNQLTVIRAIAKEDGTHFAHFDYNPKPVFNSDSVDLLNELLKSTFTGGTARKAAQLGFTREASGKTGTTNESRDSWFAGFTPEVTTVVWVGLDKLSDQVKMKIPLTGATAALPIWVDFMKKSLLFTELKNFPKNDNLVTVTVDRNSGNEASAFCPASQTTTDFYVKGRTPSTTSCEKSPPPPVTALKI